MDHTNSVHHNVTPNQQPDSTLTPSTTLYSLAQPAMQSVSEGADIADLESVLPLVDFQLDASLASPQTLPTPDVIPDPAINATKRPLDRVQHIDLQKTLNLIQTTPEFFKKRHYWNLEAMEDRCHKELHEREQLAVEAGYFTNFSRQVNSLTAAGLAARFFYYQITHPELTANIQCVFEFAEGTTDMPDPEQATVEIIRRKITQARNNRDRATFIIHGNGHSSVLCYQRTGDERDTVLLLDSTRAHLNKMTNLMNQISGQNWTGYINQSNYQHSGNGCRLLALYTALEVERYFQYSRFLGIKDLANSGNQRNNQANIAANTNVAANTKVVANVAQFNEVALPTILLPMLEQYSVLVAAGLGGHNDWEQRNAKPNVTYAEKLKRHAITTAQSNHHSPYIYNAFIPDKESKTNDFITQAILQGVLPSLSDTCKSFHSLDSITDADIEWEQQVIYQLGMQDGLPLNTPKKVPTTTECQQRQQQLAQYIQTTYPHPHLKAASSSPQFSPYYNNNLQKVRSVVAARLVPPIEVGSTPYSSSAMAYRSSEASYQHYQQRTYPNYSPNSQPSTKNTTYHHKPANSKISKQYLHNSGQTQSHPGKKRNSKYYKQQTYQR